MTPLDLDGAALRALRDLCGTGLLVRLSWVRNGVEVSLWRDGAMLGAARGSTLADVVIRHAEILGRDDVAAPLRVARARLSSAPTMRPGRAGSC